MKLNLKLNFETCYNLQQNVKVAIIEMQMNESYATLLKLEMLLYVINYVIYTSLFFFFFFFFFLGYGRSSHTNSPLRIVSL